MTLVKYKHKRNFKATPEPKGKVKRGGSKLKFVIQKHDATRLHYDFRLEMEGVLKSWAVPKGPSMNPEDKRLAIMVEDHPIEYGKFRGVIPEGNYGAGVVEIFDEGTYEPVADGVNPEKELLKELKDGNLKFMVHGKIVKGEFALVKIKDPSADNQWLLIKKKDTHSTRKKYDANDVDPIKPYKKPREKKTVRSKVKPVRKKKAGEDLNRLLRPMLAKSSMLPAPDASYSYEYKWDGFRCLALVDRGDVKLVSRNGLSLNEKFQSIAKQLEKIDDRVILDGEVVAINEKGVPEFQLIQNYQEKGADLRFYLFDLVYLNGEDVSGLTYLERRELLDLFFKKYKFRNVFISERIEGDWQKILKEAARKKYEGIIAKRNDAVYSPGLRTSAWIKLKVENNQSVLICGFTEPRGSRSKFGSILTGVYNQHGKLIYAGHCGSGFNEQSLKELHSKMKNLITSKCPFEKIPVTNQKATWIRPVLVCEVKFTEWTREGILRHPVFKGLREDLDPKKIIREPITANKNGSKRKKGD